MKIPVTRTRIPLLPLLCIALIASPPTARAQDELPPASASLPIVLPDHVSGVRECRVNLNGTWEFLPVPTREFWKDTSSTGWKPIRVPGEPMMQGFAIKHDIEYGYRRLIPIPRGFKGKRVFVRFNGVYSDARVWVNGKFVRGHRGGFTSWDCDISSLAEPGTTARLVLGVQDRVDDISFGSGYAHHPIGGILRGVELLAVPMGYLQDFYATVEFDSLNRDATLAVYAALGGTGRGLLEFSLSDPNGKRVRLKKTRISFTEAGTVESIRFPVKHPVQWDAEHPRLYTLRARLLLKGKMAEESVRRVGFREVRVRGDKFYVNGLPVKLRGACRHDIHPIQGRSTTPGQDREDAALAREANINFIRTSHYPPSQEFLDACDEYGIYVEEETAVCFVGPNRHEPYKTFGASEGDTAFTGRYLSQLREMVTRDRHHASVIIWSIGNENAYGINFQAEYDYVKGVDRTRPVMFSYPGYVPKDRACYDIASIHYVAYDGHASQLGIEIRDFGTPGMPVLHDEWAHVPCYNTPTLRTDPNVRNFWGESIKKMWDGCFNSGGGVGGAIWGFIDEYFMLPDTVVGYGPWGIVDVWRRKKPEFWLTRKAYSPVRVEQTRFDSLSPGKDLRIPVQNRFDHANLDEIEILLSAGAISSTIAGPDIPPHGRGFMTIPAAFLTGNGVGLTFVLHGTRVVDEESLTIRTLPPITRNAPRPLRITEAETRVIAEGDSYRYVFDRRTGLLEDASVGGQRILLSGPWLHLTSGGGKIDWAVDSLLDVTGNAWERDSMTIRKSPNDLSISVCGRVASLEVRFTTVVSGNGEMRTAFNVAHVPGKWREVGIRYVLDPALSRLAWTRDALWSLYPDDHIGRPLGTASKFVAAGQREAYGERPGHPWSLDTRDAFLDGKGGSGGTWRVPIDFRSTKEHIRRFALTDSVSARGVSVTSDATLAARAVVNDDGSTALIILNQWNYANLSWGNYDRVSGIDNPYHGEVHMQLISGEPPR